jgi:hypothetical protein
MLGHGDLFSFIHHLLPRIASVSLWIMIAPIVIASAIPVCDREKPNIDPHAISRIKAKVPKSTAAASGTQFLLSISHPPHCFYRRFPKRRDVYNFVRLAKNPVTCGLSCRHIVHMRS